MQTASFQNELIFSEEKVKAQLILESDFSKEIRITMRKNQVMKEHQTKFPIVVHLLSGRIEFGVRGEVSVLESGSILALEGSVPHDLKALEDSVVRLSLLKSDQLSRVEEVAKNS